jgi:hypothetical protein
MSVRPALRETHVLDIPHLGRVTAVFTVPADTSAPARIDIDVPMHPIPAWASEMYCLWVLISWWSRWREWKISHPLIVTRQRGRFCFQQKGLKVSENEGDVL